MPPKGKFQAQAGRAKCGPFRSLCHCPPTDHQPPLLLVVLLSPSSVAFCLFASPLAAASANFERVFCPFLIFILIITSIILKIKQAATLGIPRTPPPIVVGRQRQLLHFCCLSPATCNLSSTRFSLVLSSLCWVCVCVLECYHISRLLAF